MSTRQVAAYLCAEATGTPGNPTQDNTITLPDVSGTIITTGNADAPALKELKILNKMIYIKPILSEKMVKIW